VRIQRRGVPARASADDDDVVQQTSKSDKPNTSGGYLDIYRPIRWDLVQTRYLILVSLITGLAILAAAAIWFAGI
jgi:hypothetical protein